jgi:hypothetical protein
MGFTLDRILALVGRLDDSLGEENARTRFRAFLKSTVTESGQLRDFVEDCRRHPDEQHGRALQDLVNLIGEFLGFEVTAGRYQGTSQHVGHDGLWKSPKGLHVVVEVKSSETYPVPLDVLRSYMTRLTEEGVIPDIGQALGLYVIASPDPGNAQISSRILAGRFKDEMRVVSVESLLSLAEMVQRYDVDHDDILLVLRPGGATVDPLVELLKRIVGSAGTDLPAGGPVQPAPLAPPLAAADATPTRAPTSESSERPAEEPPGYFVIPASDTETESAAECIRRLVGKHGIWAFGRNAPGRKRIRAGDQVCFYAAGVGIVGHGTAAADAAEERHAAVGDPGSYPWVLRLAGVKLYVEDPVVLDADLRAQLDAFRDVRPEARSIWSWFVQASHRMSEHDFRLCTRKP